MKWATTLILAIVFAVFPGGTGSVATTVQPGYKLTDSFTGLKAGQIVVVGKVRSVSNRDLTLPNGRTQALPAIVIDVESTLFGSVADSVTVLGFNTFLAGESGWTTSVLIGSPWFVPGDRVLVKAQEFTAQPAGGEFTAFYRVRKAAFLLDDDPLGANALYSLIGGTPRVDLTDTSRASSLTVILGSLDRTPRSTGFHLGDIIAAINGEGRE